MNARSSLFSAVSIKPQGIRELIHRLPYSQHSIYHAISELKKERLIVKTKRGNEWVLDVADGYRPQKMRAIYIQALSHGVDPNFLLSDNTIRVWKALETSHTLNDIKNEVDLSERWIKKILKFFVDSGLVEYRKRRPIIAYLNENNELNHILRSFTEERGEKTIFYTDSLPFNDIIQTPSKIERLLYEMIESNLMVKDTGFQIRGQDGKVNILESVDEELDLESLRGLLEHPLRPLAALERLLDRRRRAHGRARDQDVPARADGGARDRHRPRSDRRRQRPRRRPAL